MVTSSPVSPAPRPRFAPVGLPEDTARQMFQVWGGVQAYARDEPEPQLQFESRKIGALHLTRVQTGGVVLRREPREAVRVAEPYHCVVLVTAGQQQVRLDAAGMVTQAGSVFLSRNTQSLEVDAPAAIESYALTIPTHLLKERFKDIDAKLGLLFRPADARTTLLSHHVHGLFDASTALSRGEGEALSRQFCDLFAVLAHGADSAQAVETGVSQAMRALVLDFLEKNYADDSLNPESIAARCGISVSYLYKLMAASGVTAIEYLRRVRLAAAHAMLANRQYRHLTVCEICFRCGFNSQSDFCRAFKRRYGQAPRDMRPVRQTVEALSASA